MRVIEQIILIFFKNQNYISNLSSSYYDVFHLRKKPLHLTQRKKQLHCIFQKRIRKIRLIKILELLIVKSFFLF